MSPSWNDVLGMNRRNATIQEENSPPAVRRANNKYETKRRLQQLDVPVTPTVALIRDRLELRDMDWRELPDGWALKPNQGRGGTGILLALKRDEGGLGWRTGSGELLDRSAILDHTHQILEGEFSMGGMQRDWAMFEPLIRPHASLGDLVPSGLPDIRVICYRNEPILAMTRLPTEMSGGKANLHQGAVGASIDLESGVIDRAFWEEEDTELRRHPDTDAELIGVQVPFWDEILEASARSGEAAELGYMGADIIIDVERGPLVIEVNAHPGLGIQNVTGTGLGRLLEERIARAT